MQIEPLVYSVEDIQILRNCGRDKAYAIAKRLPHYIDGKKILVFRKDHDEDFERMRQQAIEKQGCVGRSNNLFQIRKFS